jgi:hypothetical protein
MDVQVDEHPDKVTLGDGESQDDLRKPAAGSPQKEATEISKSRSQAAETKLAHQTFTNP